VVEARENFECKRGNARGNFVREKGGNKKTLKNFSQGRIWKSWVNMKKKELNLTSVLPRKKLAKSWRVPEFSLKGPVEKRKTSHE